MSVNQKGRLRIEAEPGPGLFLSEASYRWDKLTPAAHLSVRFAGFQSELNGVDQKNLGMTLQLAE